MGSQRQLLKSIELTTSGKLHYCHANKKHELPKGSKVFVVKVDRDKTHYCFPCGSKFIATAQDELTRLQVEMNSGTVQ